MRLRRFTGFLLTLLTLHLNLLGADFACAKHDSAAGDNTTEHSMAAQSAAAAEHAMAMPATANSPSHRGHQVAHSRLQAAGPIAGSTPTPEAGNATPPCDVPVQPNCCKALASCSVVFSADRELAVGSTMNVSAMVNLDAMTAPPSERAAPEPPPPKA